MVNHSATPSTPDSAAEPVSIEQPPIHRRTRHVWLAVLVWMYAAIVLAWWAFMRYGGDRWWPATLMLFAPRWPALIPAALLLLPAILLRRDLLWPLAVILFLIAVPIMGFHASRLPRTDQTRSGPPQLDLRVLTLNTHFASLNTAELRAVIVKEQPDVIVLQEWWNSNLDSVLEGLPDYSTRLWDNLALLATKYPARRLAASPALSPGSGVCYGYMIDLPGRSIQFYNVHLDSPHNSLSEVAHGEETGVNRLRQNAGARWYEAMTLSKLAADAGGSVVVAGDFNLPADSPTFRNSFSDLTDAFPAAGLGYGWTYRTNRTNVRIDHILSGRDWSCISCWVGPYVGSPHRPLLADFRFQAH